ncbi:hypothetical protein HAHI6034_01105 [Hathewaya histolytica]|uniref:DUF4259 domain-containing protein n=1 Tax=Hathewaya histolytica TaxID=1498 RepID=A0A4U9QZI0_HATHI|nr:hypothetical protein [Hathewaya histolytica]VTQ83568.1 Uncharacterised protein [Hathewaya histolytica]
MGAWGTAIFSDDVADDIRSEYNSLLSVGASDEEATSIIFNMYYFDECEGTEDEPIFWFALALAQWKKGRLTEDIRDAAIEFINIGDDLERWNIKGAEKDYEKRKKVLENLRETLLSPMPERKKVRKPTVIISPWKPGDVLCYQLNHEKIKGEKYYGKYVLLRVLKVLRNPFSVLKQDEYFQERILFGLYDWSGDKPPTYDITNNLEYIPLQDYEDMVLGRRYGNCGMLSWWAKRELKERNITVIGNDASYADNIPKFFRIGLTECPMYHFENIDIFLNQALLDFSKTNNK